MKKQLKSIAKSITVFILLIFCAVVIDARAEDYLWEPTLAWEDPSPGIGHKLLNNDEWLIYYADNKVQLRELATGKKLAESEDMVKFLEKDLLKFISFAASDDGKTVYVLFTRGDHYLVKFESTTLKPSKVIRIQSHWQLDMVFNGERFHLGSPISCYYVADNDFRVIYETQPYYEKPLNPGDPVKPEGTCIIGFNPEATEHLFVENKDSYKMLFYNETQFLKDCEWVFINNEQYHCIDPVSLKIVHSDELPFTVSPRMKYILQERKDKIEVLNYKTKDVVNTYSFKELSVDTIKVAAPFKVPLRLLRDDNPERVFPFSSRPERLSSMNYISNFYYSGKKRKLSKIVPTDFGDIYARPELYLTDNKNQFLLVATKIMKVYSIKLKSKVLSDKEKNDIIVDTVNANIPIPNGKYPEYISIYSSDGKLVEETKEITIFSNHIIYNIENLSNGIYIINIKFEDGSSQSFKFVKGK